MYFRILFCTFWAGVCVWSQDEELPSVRLRVQSFARESALITNPIAWAQLEDRVAEGTRVKKGDAVFTLDLKGTRDEIQELGNRLESAENESDKQVADMESTLQLLRDQRETLVDNRNIQQAKLTFLRSLPREEDLAIAQGRLSVAKERMEAEEKNLSTMQDRLARKLIAPSQLQQAEWAHGLQNARTEYAIRMLEIAQRPARPEEIRMVELRIRNLDLEIKKLDNEIPSKETILTIRQQSRTRQRKALLAELAEREQELTFRELLAPVDGVLLYSTQLKRDLTAGTKPSKGMVIGEIPDTKSIAFSGVIPEQMRHLYQLGDPAQIHLNMFPGRTLMARLAEISPFSRDAQEDEENPSGVKLVDVELVLLDPPEDLPLGIYGWATLTSTTPLNGHKVPVSWVRYQGGKPHLSVNGLFQPVDGILQGEHFILTPPHPAVRDLTASGSWPQVEEEMKLDTGSRFAASGELLPLESIEVKTPRMRVWDIKITSLHPDNTRIEQGEVVALLDSQLVEDDVVKQGEDLERQRGDREATEQELDIVLSKRNFQLASATNKVEIARLNRDLVITKNTDAEVARARMSLTTATIELQAAQTELERGLRTPELTAKAEQERREREVIRKKLALERAQIQVAQAEEGSSERDQSLSRIQAKRAETELIDIEARFQRDVTRIQSNLQGQIRRERRDENRLQKALDDREALKLRAPVSGLVKYEKIWDGVRRSKIRPGMRVYPKTPLLSLSNTTEVFVEVPLPERYVHELEVGMPVEVVIPSEGNLQWRGYVAEFAKILEPARPDTRPGSIYGNQEITREQILPVKVVVESTEDRILKPGAIAQLIFPFDK